MRALVNEQTCWIQVYLLRTPFTVTRRFWNNEEVGEREKERKECLSPSLKDKDKKHSSSLRIDWVFLSMAILSVTAPLENPFVCPQGRGDALSPVRLFLVRLLLSLAQPGEEGGDWFQGHTFPRLLCRVFAGLPFVKGLFLNDIFVIQGVKEHPEQVCAARVQNTGILWALLLFFPLSIYKIKV